MLHAMSLADARFVGTTNLLLIPNCLSFIAIWLALSASE